MEWNRVNGMESSNGIESSEEWYEWNESSESSDDRVSDVE